MLNYKPLTIYKSAQRASDARLTFSVGLDWLQIDVVVIICFDLNRWKFVVSVS